MYNDGYTCLETSVLKWSVSFNVRTFVTLLFLFSCGETMSLMKNAERIRTSEFVGDLLPSKCSADLPRELINLLILLVYTFNKKKEMIESNWLFKHLNLLFLKPSIPQEWWFQNDWVDLIKWQQVIACNRVPLAATNLVRDYKVASYFHPSSRFCVQFWLYSPADSDSIELKRKLCISDLSVFFNVFWKSIWWLLNILFTIMCYTLCYIVFPHSGQ